MYKEYNVLGTAEVLVSAVVKAKSPEHALRLAQKKHARIHEYCGNGGTDKLIGVEANGVSIFANQNVVFDNVFEEATGIHCEISE